MSKEELTIVNRKILEAGFPKVIIGDFELIGIRKTKQYDSYSHDVVLKTLNDINNVFLSKTFNIDKDKIPKYKVATIINYSHIWKSRKFEYTTPVFIKE